MAAHQFSVREDLFLKLAEYPIEVLEYVALMFKSRDGVVARRLTSILGNSRGNGMLGLLFAALAGTSSLNFLKTLFPHWSAGWFLFAFVLLVASVVYMGYGLLAIGHQSGRLLYYAELLEAVVQLKERNAHWPQLAPVATPIEDKAKEAIANACDSEK